jgi:hypothetical protein
LQEKTVSAGKFKGKSFFLMPIFSFELIQDNRFDKLEFIDKIT